MKPYDTVTELEKQVAAYAGAPYAVAVDSCSNAIMIALMYEFMNGAGPEVEIPRYTYVGVPQSILNVGGKIVFRDENWQGIYELRGTRIIDSARRFTKNMYIPGTLYCLSAHWAKILKIGRGGFILTDDEYAYENLRRIRFDGRREGVAPKDDSFDIVGYHCYMLPEEAARGLMLMATMPDYNPDVPWDGYTDLSQHPRFK